MIIKEYKHIPESLEAEIIKDSSNKEFNEITAYTLVNGCIDEYFYKKINMPKVRERYSGNYAELLTRYYERLRNCVNCNEMYGIISIEDDLYEVSQRIDESTILCDDKHFTYNQIKNIFQVALMGIKRMESKGETDLGIDSAIWNYTTNGIFFDYDPPKILDGNSSLFITANDEDYKQRVLYRNFNYEGMRTNLLGTIFLGNENWNFTIDDFPQGYAEELINLMLMSIDDDNHRTQLEKIVYGKENKEQEFDKHPIDIIRKELVKKNDRTTK